MDGWVRGEREDGGVCKVGRKVGARGEKSGKRSLAGGVEARARRGWGGRGAGVAGGKACRKHAAQGRGAGDSLKGKKGAKEPGRWSTGKGEEEADVGKKGRRTEV